MKGTVLEMQKKTNRSLGHKSCNVHVRYVNIDDIAVGRMRGMRPLNQYVVSFGSLSPHFTLNLAPFDPVQTQKWPLWWLVGKVSLFC